MTRPGAGQKGGDMRDTAAGPAATAMPGGDARLRAVETWVFDLDDTLYDARSGLLGQINARMTAYIQRELGVDRARAEDVRGRYWRRYGITLTGLIRHHGVAPGHFLAEVHDLDYAALRPDPALAGALARLAVGRRLIVHTNGARAHAERVLERLGLSGAFAAVYAIEDKALVPKPQAEAYARVIEADGFAPGRAAMIEDSLANLVEPRRLGMATVWLTAEGGRPVPRNADTTHVDHRIDRLVPFLDRLTR